ncbi:MAG: hypothetical protein GY760_10840 [Deltaproteobacteria bacterium]|nr:hypothetical protein [Deltaproteobacteria bacterium]
MLKSKLLIPQIRKYLNRPRLFKLLESIKEKKLTLISAGAGYGKTTLIAEKVRKLPLNTIWYSISESDNDFQTFLSYLYKGYSNLYDSKRVDFVRRPEPLSRKMRLQLITGFLSDAEERSDDLIIVLDDFHLVNKNDEICELVEFLLTNMSSSIHMIIITRVQPNIRISKIRAMQEVLDIKAKDIQFSIEETEELYSNLFNQKLSRKNILILHKKSCGWAAILVLFHYTIEGMDNNNIESILQNLNGSQNLIFDYLEENIFEQQSSEIINFMIKTSILNNLDIKYCNKLLKIDNSSDILERLAKNNLLTLQYEKRYLYYYHHLLQNFLEKKRKSILSKSEIINLNLSLAKILEEDGDIYGAIEYYLKGECYKKAVEKISSVEDVMFQTGKLNTLRNYIGLLPDEYINNSPDILFVIAKVHSFSGKLKNAIDIFKRSLESYREICLMSGVLKCETQLGLHYYYTGNIYKAEIHLENLFKSNSVNNNSYFEITGLLILISSILGKVEKADYYYDTASDKLKKLADPLHKNMDRWINFTYSYRYYVSGDFKKSYKISQKILNLYKKDKIEIILPIAYLHLSLPCYYLNLFEEGCENARNGIALIEKQGINDNQVGWLNYALAINNEGLGNVSEALKTAKISQKIFKKYSNIWGIANTYHLLHIINIKKGKLNEAQEYLNKGIHCIRYQNLPYTEGILETDLARVLIEKGEFDEVPALINSAMEKVSSSMFYTFKNYISLSRYSLLRGSEGESSEMLVKAISIAYEYNYEIHILNETSWIIPLLVKLFYGGIRKKYIQKLFKQMDRNTRNELIILKKGRSRAFVKAINKIIENMPLIKAEGLKINLLGKFRVFISDVEVPDSNWKSLKALMIFKYLASNYNKGFIHRDVLIEILWPDENYLKTTKRFNVAISALRKILEPDLKRGCPSSYIIKQALSFKLDIGKNGSIDIFDFLSKFESGKKYEKKNLDRSIQYYIDAESYYTEVFLSEDMYTGWCIEKRDLLQNKYLLILSKLMACFNIRKEYSKCIYFGQKYISIDESNEKFYREMMLYYSKSDNFSEISKMYEKCRLNILKSIDSELSTTTKDLYKKLMKRKKS